MAMMGATRRPSSPAGDILAELLSVKDPKKVEQRLTQIQEATDAQINATSRAVAAAKALDEKIPALKARETAVKSRETRADRRQEKLSADADSLAEQAAALATRYAEVTDRETALAEAEKVSGRRDRVLSTMETDLKARTDGVVLRESRVAAAAKSIGLIAAGLKP